MRGTGAGRTAALLLGGGRSLRFGGESKALATLDRRPSIERMAELVLRAGLSPVVAVLSLRAAAAEGPLRALGVRSILSPRTADGRTASIQVGLEDAGDAFDLLLWPVDHPFVEAKTLRTLIEVRKAERMGVWFIPTYDSEGGHPVLLAPTVLKRIPALGPDTPLRTLRAEFAAGVVRVPVDDPAVATGVHTREDFDRELRAWRLRQGGAG